MYFRPRFKRRLNNKISNAELLYVDPKVWTIISRIIVIYIYIFFNNIFLPNESYTMSFLFLNFNIFSFVSHTDTVKMKRLCTAAEKPRSAVFRDPRNRFRFWRVVSSPLLARGRMCLIRVWFSCLISAGFVTWARRRIRIREKMAFVKIIDITKKWTMNIMSRAISS